MLCSRVLWLALPAVFLAGCTEIMVGNHLLKKGQRCHAEGQLKVGNPYIVDGVRYEPINSSYNFREEGIASWYGEDFHGKPTANGECYNMYAFTAAHKTLPLPSIVRVTNLENRKSVVLEVNDRGPFVPGRTIDLSYAAAQSLGVVTHGTAPVLVEAIGGPHHHPRGASGVRRTQAIALGPNDQRAETLPSVMPSSVTEEELGETPDATAEPVVSAERKEQRDLGVPDPDTSLPSPPTYETRMVRDTTPLKHTLVYVQVGAFADPAKAQSALSQLQQTFKTASMAPITTAQGATLQRVQVGPFRSVADADAALVKALAQGFPEARLRVEQK